MREKLKTIALIIGFVLMLTFGIWFNLFATCDWIASYLPFAPLPARCFKP